MDSVGAEMSIFDVDANPKISISIPVDLPKKSDGMAKINDFCDFDALWSKFSSPAAGRQGPLRGGRGEGGIILNRELS